MTPLSVAGVARRTTARVVVAETAAVGATAAANTAAVSQQQAATAQQQAATAKQQSATAQQQAAAARPVGAPAIGTVVNTLPAGCVPEVKGGVEYQKCGGVYYRSAFQGNNLVYVAQ
jgi:biotin carboxyl carrier protein